MRKSLLITIAVLSTGTILGCWWPKLHFTTIAIGPTDRNLFWHGHNGWHIFPNHAQRNTPTYNAQTEMFVGNWATFFNSVVNMGTLTGTETEGPFTITATPTFPQDSCHVAFNGNQTTGGDVLNGTFTTTQCTSSQSGMFTLTPAGRGMPGTTCTCTISDSVNSQTVWDGSITLSLNSAEGIQIQKGSFSAALNQPLPSGSETLTGTFAGFLTPRLPTRPIISTYFLASIHHAYGQAQVQVAIHSPANCRYLERPRQAAQI
jgi:hypothetical protein